MRAVFTATRVVDNFCMLFYFMGSPVPQYLSNLYVAMLIRALSHHASGSLPFRNGVRASHAKFTVARRGGGLVFV